MPSIATVFGYHIYFWSREQEPVHVHVCKGTPTENATKFWITCSGGALMVKNSSRIPKNDLKKLESWISANVKLIVSRWVSHFGVISYYC